MIVRKKYIEATETTPEIILSPEGILSIKGRCMEQNASTFLTSINEWLNENGRSPFEIKLVDICLEYVNEFSSTILISILKRLLHIKRTDKELPINWYYDDGDEDILELGEHVSVVLDTPFNFYVMYKCF